MASFVNAFDLLEDVESDDTSLLIAATEKKLAAKKLATEPTVVPAAGGKMPSKPLPPAQAVREARNNNSNTGAPRGGRGYGGRGRGGRGFDRPNPNRDFSSTNGGGATYAGGADTTSNGVMAAPGEQDKFAGRQQPYRARRGGYGDEEGRGPRRQFDRHSGTGRAYGVKKDGAGRGNWGTDADETPLVEGEVNLNATEEKPVVEGAETEAQKEGDEVAKEKESDAKEDAAAAEEKARQEEEDKEMTLEEYEKMMEEKRKAFVKAEERKVEVDKELLNMQVLSVKKNNDEVFIKLGAEKDGKKKTTEEKVKKLVSINEFLKPAEGERSYGGRRGGRGGRGRGGRGDFGNGNRGNYGPAPSISDQTQFPTLGGAAK